MSARDTGGAAFPHQIVNENGIMFFEPGMTMRDWFAGQFAAQMAIDLARINREEGGEFVNVDMATARTAYRYADAMLVARSEP